MDSDVEALRPFLREGRLAVPPGDLARLARARGRPRLVRALSRLAAAGELAFPYKAAFIAPPAPWFARLRAAQYVEVGEDRRLRPRAGVARWAFRAGGGPPAPLAFTVGARAYAEVDQVTDLFTEEARMAARVGGRLSPAAAWRSRRANSPPLRAAVDLALRAKRPLDGYALREGSYAKVPECTQFKVTLAAAVYRFFRARRALDPFAGWGDRALGAAGAGVGRYAGVDPNPALAPGHGRILRFLAGEGRPGYVLRSAPFEEYTPAMCREDFPGGAPDLVFSSPPFHRYEIYSDDPGQSSRHRTLAGWLAEWFLPATDRAWGLLAPGGHLAFYLADARGEITGPLRRHMEAAGREFLGVIACRRREASGRLKRPLPLWVWRKAEETMDEFIEGLFA